jgi:outer membrane protein TolC
MKKLISILAIFIAITSQAQTLTIEACQDSALHNYPLIQQYGLIEKTKELTLSNANKNYLPQLDITLIGGIIEGMPSFSLPGAESSASTEVNLISMVQLNQVLWDGGMTKASKGIIEAGSEIEKADLEVNLYQLKERVNNLYFGILLIDEQITQLDLLKETLLLNQKRIQNAIENGTAFKSDADELKVELINIEQKKAELLYNKEAYIAVLSIMTGEKITLETNFIRPDFSSSLEEISINRPEMMKFKNQQSLVESQAKLNKATLIPKFGLVGFGVFITPGVDFGTSELTNIFVAGLSLSWQLGPFYKNANNKKLTEISLQRIQNQEETFLFNTKLELSQTNTEMEKYRKLLEMDREILLLKSSIKDAYMLKYDNGVATMTDVLQRINDESAAKQMMIMHEIQYLMKAYQYLNKSGN